MNKQINNEFRYSQPPRTEALFLTRDHKACVQTCAVSSLCTVSFSSPAPLRLLSTAMAILLYRITVPHVIAPVILFPLYSIHVLLFHLLFQQDISYPSHPFSLHIREIPATSLISFTLTLFQSQFCRKLVGFMHRMCILT